MRLVFTIILINVSFLGYAQEYEYSEKDIYRSPIRAVLNQFSFQISTGYNRTNYKHDLSGYYYLQSPAQQFIVLNEGVPLEDDYVAYDNWFNHPSIGIPIEIPNPTDVPFPSIDNPVYNSELNRGLTQFDADSIGLGFEGRGRDIPLNINIRYNYKGIRVGGGISMAYHKISSFKPTVDGHGIRSIHPVQRTTFFFKYYGLVGYKFYDWWDYSFAAEIEIGKNKLGKQFSGAVTNGVYYNFGISIEKNLSEYFRVFVKPSFDFRTMNTALPEGGGSIKNKYNAFNLGVGISVTFPEIPRSPMKSDKVQLKHVIVDPKSGKYKEVRGQPIWKKQNPKVGQNNRKTIRQKWGNSRKLNPY
ncbi:hypothetical protein [Reichenbachiella versicolor]|uniref:hypothetical protein n=1 Tax=Reichenbachiella versicolor TaxID=1821036 RepID=UPI000D6E86E7|nr:hypothetical protein [Reichenbachiella versicolor]